MNQVVVLRVYCGQCAKEGRRKPELIGQIDSGNGGTSWFVRDNRRKRRDALVGDHMIFGKKRPSEAFLSGIALTVPQISHYTPPAELFAFCKNHGQGRVLTSDVLNRSGSVVLNLIATA